MNKGKEGFEPYKLNLQSNAGPICNFTHILLYKWNINMIIM